MKGLLFAGIAVAFFVLAWMFLRLASIFSTTEQSIKDVSKEVVPLLGKTHVTVDNINSQLSQLDGAVGDVAGMTGELDQTTAVITRGVRGSAIKVKSNGELGQGGRRCSDRGRWHRLRDERRRAQAPSQSSARPPR